MSAGAEQERVPVYVWDVVVRLTHWTIALSIFTLSVTGIYIGKPFITTSVPATQAFIMGTVRVIHFYVAMAFTLAVLVRIVWMFLGPRWARWNQLVPTSKQRLADMWGTLRFYSFVDAKPPHATGHNAMAGFAYIGAFTLYLVMIVTGNALYGASAHVESPLRVFAGILPYIGGAQVARWIHHVAMWLILGFVVQHVYSGLLTSIIERNGELDSIVSGHKHVPAAAGTK
jgi:Ni/Fe-hydrogenase 1 B-type cytochrome subunit